MDGNLCYEKCKKLKTAILQKGYTPECFTPGLMRIVGDLFKGGKPQADIQHYSTPEQQIAAEKVKKTLEGAAYSKVVGALKNKNTAMQVHLHWLKKGERCVGYVFAHPQERGAFNVKVVSFDKDPATSECLALLLECLKTVLTKKGKRKTLKLRVESDNALVRKKAAHLGLLSTKRNKTRKIL
jgi:hypothetical protein